MNDSEGSLQECFGFAASASTLKESSYLYGCLASDTRA
jgi:hypothetical protein